MLLPISAFVFLGLAGAQNLFKNADFEEEFSRENWWCNGCTLQSTIDAHRGQYGGQITGRTANWNGLYQDVDVRPDGRYHISVYVKLMNQNQFMLSHRVELMMLVTYQDDMLLSEVLEGDPYSWKTHVVCCNSWRQRIIVARKAHYEHYCDENKDSVEYALIGVEPYLRMDQGWQKVGGDYRVQNKGVRRCQFYMQLPQPEVNYVVDTASMTEIVFPTDWWNEANERIDMYRKNDIALNIDIGKLDPQALTVELRQRKQAFAWGSAVQSALLTGPNRAYQDFFNNTFDWAVMEYEMKWRQMERNRGEIDFELADPGIAKLLADGKDIRGHAVYWGVNENVPDWLKPLSSDVANAEINRRAEYTVPHYRGKVRHWDVNNEQLHGAFFEEKTRNVVILSEMFNKTHELDPAAKLFINDYAILSSSEYTQALVKSANELKYLNTPIYGIGIQSHLQGMPQIDQLMDRLQTVSEAGLPIWITELDVEIEDREARAQGYENVLRLYFSWPEIEGVLLWGFWDGAHWRPNAALVEGPELQLNDAGRRVVGLLKNEWMTSADFYPTSSQNRFETRGFHGDYELQIKENGNVIEERFFTLKKSDMELDIYI